MAGTSPNGVTPKPMKGPEKVAALLLAMGKPLAGRLLKHFDEEELRQITRSVAALGTVTIPTLEVLIEEFAKQFVAGADLLGSPAEVENLLAGILTPEQIADIMSDVTGKANQTMWERLSTVPENLFAGYLTKEHPQTVAIILSKVPPACAAKTMSLLPRNLRNEIMRRMLSFSSKADRAMRILESVLQDDLLYSLARNSGDDQNARMADIINKMERDQMEDVLNSLAEERPKQAETLRGLLFTFDDIVKLQPRARMQLFEKIPTERVIMALKGTDASFKDAILSSMTARARRIVEAELSSGGPAPHRDVLKARRSVADYALEMAERGEIELHSSEEEDELYQ